MGETLTRFLIKVYLFISVPIAILIILNSNNIHKSYNFNLRKKIILGFRMFFNTVFIETCTSYKSHLVMALKILETSNEVVGDIVECGTFKGGSAANLSLVCDLVGRKLLIFDSFEGLPEGKPKDREAKQYKKGDYCGTLKEVEKNISIYGKIDSCLFIKGWYEETLPQINSPILLAFVDVDLEDSLYTCVKNIWPHLVDEGGFLFIDEMDSTDYCALFYSEKFWKTNFGRKPPGLIGAGTGLPLGGYYIGPWLERNDHPTWCANAPAFTKKDMSGHWSYYPDEIKE